MASPIERRGRVALSMRKEHRGAEHAPSAVAEGDPDDWNVGRFSNRL